MLLVAASARADDVKGAWHFKTDPKDQGIKLGWQKLNFDDSSWEPLVAGKPWEDQGYKGYDGLGWYRKKITVPADLAGEKLVLVFPGVDDAYEAWVDGKFAGRSGSMMGGASVWNVTTMVGLPGTYAAGDTIEVALRVMDWGDLGGLRGAPIRIEKQPSFDVLDLGGTWRFSKDAKNKGVAAGWAKPGFDDSGWKELKVPERWEDQIGAYDGWGWYRKTVKLGDTWPAGKGYVVFGGVDDAYVLYVNGDEVATHGSLTPAAGDQSVYNKTTTTDIGKYCAPGAELTLAVRVMDWGGNGGITAGPAMLVPDPSLAGDWGKVLGLLANMNPDWYVPAWVRGGAKIWTVAGVARAIDEALAGPDGSVQPQNESYSLTPVVYDADAGKLVTPHYDFDAETWAGVKWHLKQDVLPIIEWEYDAYGLKISEEFFVWNDQAKACTAYGRVTVQNTGAAARRLKLFMLARPYRLNGKVASAETAKVQGPDVLLDGKLFAEMAQAPAASGICRLLDGDPTGWATKGEVPSVKDAPSHGPASAALSWKVDLAPGKSWQVGFAAPQEPPAASFRPLSYDEAVQQCTDWWEAKLGRTKWNLPDPRVAMAAEANAGYMLVSMDGDQPHPGPLAYDSFWCRDSSYQIAAMLGLGLTQDARDAASVYARIQLPDGEFPSIVSTDYKPVGPHEWDAQGQGIFALMEVYRFTHDRAWLAKVYPTIRRACQFLQQVRESTMTQKVKDAKPPLNFGYGILSPSVSAEDLGPGDWYHYWDDLWGIGGWREAAAAARDLGKTADAKWMDQQGAALMASTADSMRGVMSYFHTDYIPNGPNDKDSSSMARGTSPGVFPCQVLSTSDPLTRRSFDVYWDKWIAKTGGGYVHHGVVWGYGMELGACYVMLGERQRAWEVLQWYLNHQSAPGVYAWGESFDPRTGRFLGGDMPHTWVGADYINLLRTCLLYERGDQLVLLAGVPESWLTGTRTFSVSGLPTFWGDLDMTVTPKGASADGRVHVKLGGTCRPPKGFVLDLPQDLRGVIG